MDFPLLALHTARFPLLSYSIGEDTVGALLVAVGTFVVVYIALAVAWKYVLHRIHAYAKRTRLSIDDAIVGVLRGVGAPSYFVIALFVAVQPLVLSPVMHMGIKVALLVVIIAETIKIAERVTQFFLIKGMRLSGSGVSEEQRVSSVFSVFIKIVLWSLGLLLILSNLGFNVTSLMAGLGIGGLAISLALQNVLGDMFSSLSIAIDKPFKEGDFIIVGQEKGTVKHIGLKTTRIESLQGEEIVISNNELTTARVQNFKKMERRRSIFVFGVTYATPADKLKKIPGMIKDIILAQEKTAFDRAHWKEFGDFSLNFEIVYYVLSNEYNMYMDIQQAINVAILEAFQKEGIEIAFPTQTVYVEKS
ncbi:mechanosensitive ion channel protein MscS [Candidatus Peregrinibacteria bacterium CG10_big_fil_rev_8_21_14_0_10_55_24]|nr:MAG: mechanosensitive ion channel protein MscS [Candidatus Peregrinibacteria bacterium CG10_big_fil_rev_8_21_14_0_10_55_24]